MNVQISVLILEALVKFGPSAARAIADLFRKDTITAADWDKVFDLAEKSYESYIKK